MQLPERQLVDKVFLSFCLMYNVCRTYGIKHTFSQQCVKMHMPGLTDLLEQRSELVVCFHHEQVLFEDTPLTKNVEQYKQISHALVDMGVSGLRFRKGLTPDELTLFLNLLLSKSDEVAQIGLKKMLLSCGIKHVQPFTAPHDGGKGEGKTGRSAVDAGVFELALEETDGFGQDFEAPSQPVVPPENHGDYRSHIRNTVTDYINDAITADQMADRISEEFDARLEVEIQEYRTETIRTKRKLDNVKDILIRKMEDMHVPSLVVDADMQSLVMTSAARNMLHNAKDLSAYPQLVDFVSSGQPSAELVLDGVPRKVIAVRSGPLHREDDDNIVMLTIE